MVLVLGIAGVIAALVAVTMAMTVQSMKSSRQHVTFESAMSAAETGVDQTLSYINTAFNATPSANWVNPAPCNLTATPTFATAAAEKAWIRANLLPLAANPACLKTGGQGEYVAVHPANIQTVYSIGFSPSYSAWVNRRQDAKMRTVKAEYLFAPFKPGQAVLSSGPLDFSGSVTVNTLNPSYPADIHSNSSITNSGSGSLTINGSISSSGTNSMNGSSCPAGVTGGCTQNDPPERVPATPPRTVYDREARLAGLWFDLCYDGSVRTPNPTPGTDPCTGAEVSTGGVDFNGWSFTPGNATTVPVWTLKRQAGVTTYPGVYYVYGGDAVVGDTGTDATVWNITVLAEGAKGAAKPAGFSEADRCDKYGGNLEWRLFTIHNYLQGLVFDAEGSITGSANTAAYAGFILAGDNVDLQTSSNTITGAVITNNTCSAAGDNKLQGVTINYDQTIEGPVSDTVRTTLWLEYPGI